MDGLTQATSIVDRTKDLIKSGGEWISSIELENAVCSHPGIQEAAAIAIPDDKWGERPLLLCVLRQNAQVNKEDLLPLLASALPKWAVPDQIEFIAELPKGATGKILKTELRKLYPAIPEKQLANHSKEAI
jgi:3-(methylthio)propionyl---CoA ligase